MKKQHAIFAALAIVAVAAFVFFSRSPDKAQAPTNIKIAAILPLTGPGAYLGEDERKGLAIMAQLLERAGTAKISLTFEDSQNQATQAISAYNKIVSTDHPFGVIVTHSGVCGPISEYVSGQASALYPLTIGTVTASTKITLNNDVFLRAYPSGRDEAAAMAEFLAKRKRFKRVFILYQNDDYGVDGRDQFSESFTAHGGTVLAAEGYAKEATDLKSLLAKIPAHNPECIYLVGNSPAYALAFKQLAELRLNVTLASGSALDVAKIRQQAGLEAIKGSYYTTPFVETPQMLQNPRYVEFKAELTKQKVSPSVLSIYPALSLQLLIDFWQKTSGDDDARRKAVLSDLDKYAGDSFLGAIRFDSTRNAILPVFVRQVVELDAASDATIH